MKRLVILFLTVSLLCSAFAVGSFAVLYGDVNCDGDVKNNDAVLLAQYLALWKVDISEEGMTAADVRYDGQINVKDAVLLAQHLALWGVTLGPDTDSGTDPNPPVTTEPDDSEVDTGTGDNEVPADDLIY